MFITFEGIEGSGKSTQAKLLYEWFLDRGRRVVLTREPGGTEAAERIRDLILREWEESFPPFSELCLYLAARGFHVKNLIKPSLSEGAVVICDRFSDSTLAYQGYGRGLDLELIKEMNREATEGIKPDLTFLIDVPVEVGLERIGKRRRDRIEGESLEFHRRVRRGFLDIAGKEPERVVVVDGTGSREEVFEFILSVLKEKGYAP
ncbi:MAG: dTMP kinase [Desulfurobacteriaceae bacterium]